MPIWFALFINDLVYELNTADLGVPIGDTNLSILMYADDVVLLSGSHDDAQAQLNIMTEWCKTWGMYPNIKKSQVVHHRWPRKRCCKKNLLLDNKPMEYVDNYKYLGCWIIEFGNHKITVESLTSVAGCS